MNPSSKRLVSLEFGRVLAAWCVVAIHLQIPTDPVLNFGVPYFFALSGYLVCQDVLKGRDAGKLWVRFSGRHLTLFGAWAFIFTVLPSSWPMDLVHHQIWGAVQKSVQLSMDKFLTNPLNWMLDGPPSGFHLWYLTCAPIAAGLALLAHRVWPTVLLALLVTFAFWVLIRVGDQQCVGTAIWATNAKLGILVGVAAFGGGWFAARVSGSSRLVIGAVLVCAGMGLVWALEHISSCPSVGGLLVGVGLLALLSGVTWMPAERLWLAAGRLTLGVYLIHIAIRPLYFAIQRFVVGYPHQIGYAILFFASVATVTVAVRFKIGRTLLT
jgi:peptidoglycan/LPS O-acetylase OafA/YrhL